MWSVKRNSLSNQNKFEKRDSTNFYQRHTSYLKQSKSFWLVPQRRLLTSNGLPSCHYLCIYMGLGTLEGTKGAPLKGKFTFIYAYTCSVFTNVQVADWLAAAWCEKTAHTDSFVEVLHLNLCVSLQVRFSRTTVEPLQMSPSLSKSAVPDLFHARVASVSTLLHITFGPVLHASVPFLLLHVRKSCLLQPRSSHSSLPSKV